MNPGAEPSVAARHRLLHEFFLRSAARHPHRTAVDVPPGIGRPLRQQATYAQLQRRAAELSRRLQLPDERLVAVLLPRGIDLFAAQLAILCAGGAHVCLEPSLPDEHLAYVLRDCQPVALLTDRQGAFRARDWLPPERILDIGEPGEGESGGANPPAWLRPEHLAYVIYTSGTTGWPKGVMLEHRGIVNLIAADCETFGLTEHDRVAQGSSAAYDSSLEETWLAFAAGACVVVMDADTARLGPDLVPWLRAERITVLCPPPTLLRATGCKEPGRELPELRLCYVGGEALPPDLAERWARTCWLENGYGPTECTVTVVRGRVRPGEPVGIGHPVPGHRAFVLDDDLREVARGDPGELCLAGPGLARGYLGAAELTQRKFPHHPVHGRIYRTGDLVRQGDDGGLFYLGRIDAQVKLRGHRIELEAIEAKLQACAGVGAAACRVQGEAGDQLLAAFVVPTDAAAPPAWPELLADLGRSLPAHMLPSRFALLPALPTSVGGKLDRKALPEIPAAAATERSSARPLHDALQARIAAAFAHSLGGVLVGGDDDYFDLGGNSLRAAELISSLRGDPSTALLTVRDVYQERTVAALAACARRREPLGPGAAPARARGGHPLLVTALQALFLLLVLVGGSTLAGVAFYWLLPWLVLHLGLVATALLLPPLGLLARAALAGAAVGLAIGGKRLLVGRYVAQVVPAWSGYHLRHWLVQRLAQLVPWGQLQGTALHGAVLRRLGARVGKAVHIHRGVDLTRGGWDLLTLGDGAVLGQDASLGLVELDAGCVVFAPVEVGAHAALEVRAGMCGDTVLGPGAVLAPLSSLASGGRVPAGERWDGVPARPAGRAAEPPATNGEPELSATAQALWMFAERALQTLVLSLPFVLLALLLVAVTGLDAAGFLQFWYAPWSHPFGVALVSALAVVTVPATLLVNALWLRFTPARGGCRSLRSHSYVHIWLRSGLVDAASRWLSGTLFWPLWLRLAGARIGTGCEISSIIDVLPEHLHLGDDCFLADGIYLGGPRLHHGTATVATTSLGSNTFLGNHVVVPAGAVLPADMLVGVSTVADPERMAPGTDWFGHPPFQLPRREVVEVDRRLTHEPTPLRVATRLFWELLRFALPTVPLLTAALWLQGIAASHAAGAAFLLFVLPLWTLLAAAVPVTLLLLLKWLLLGRVRPGQHVLWSCWCSRWDFLYVAWTMYARGLLLQFEGTLLLAMYLRLCGMRIGRRVLLGPGFAQVVDPDMLQFDDGATVDCMFQAHSFEDRVLKIDRVRIRAGATVGRAAVLLYGADIGEGATVLPHSVVMKHERLLPGQRYEGAPTRPV